MTDEYSIVVRDLSIGWGDTVLMEHLNFSIRRGDVFVIMGPSGCGKSTLMRHLIGLNEPAAGSVLIEGEDLWKATPAKRRTLMRRFGVLYQSGALWSSMTLGENVSLPLREFTRLNRQNIEEVTGFKLALVGLSGFESRYPSELSGGMQKRGALARAMALDPDILFFDEPSAGLDPITSRRLDELIRTVSEGLGITVVLVTHELESIFEIGTDSIMLDAEERGIIGRGRPTSLLKEATHPKVRSFLTRKLVADAGTHTERTY